ncbi:MAG: hypothetical protein EU530_06910 [Promethearchaeota archaeon]|nr:MAG: hypothetical protein EU530_06910 [Candidatus Lokiarchaeota archaeon]
MAFNQALLAILEIVFAFGLIGFWIYFFLVENKNPQKSKEYLSYERSFPVPDLIWLTPGLIVSAVGVLLHQAFGYILTIAVSGGLIFLGLVDISFNFQNKQYTSNIGDSIMNIFINLACITLGPIFIIGAAQYIGVL